MEGQPSLFFPFISSRGRQYLLYFGGTFRLDSSQYSGGARQAYHKHVVEKNDPRVRTGGGHEEIP